MDMTIFHLAIIVAICAVVLALIGMIAEKLEQRKIAKLVRERMARLEIEAAKDKTYFKGH